MRNAAIYFLAFTGGFTIMSIELLGGRILAPFFGSSVYVWGSIITIFMLALSGGYLIGGRFSLHAPSLTRFGLLFIAGAVLIGPLLLAGTPIMEWVFIRVEDPRYGSPIAATALFLLPTVMLGMISPYSVRYSFSRRRKRTGRRIPVLRVHLRQRPRHARHFVLFRSLVRGRPDPDRSDRRAHRLRRTRRRRRSPVRGIRMTAVIRTILLLAFSLATFAQAAEVIHKRLALSQ